jgi:dihydroxy-acid dehydratase
MTTAATPTRPATAANGHVLNKYSGRITQPAVQGASQAMLLATGLSLADLDKPQIGIASVWYEGNPCNMHLAKLGEHVKEGVVASDCVGMRFNTIGVSDGISMGTDGMSYSLQSRDLIADSSRRSPAPSGTTASSRSPAATRTCPAASWPWPASTARRSWSTAARSAPAAPRSAART